MVHDYNYNNFNLTQHCLFMNSLQSIYIIFFTGIQVINPNALQGPICFQEVCLCLFEGKQTGNLPSNVQETNVNHSKLIFLMFLHYVLCLNKNKKSTEVNDWQWAQILGQSSTNFDLALELCHEHNQIPQ